MSSLPEDIVNHICCLAIKLKDPHPFVDEIKTLNMIGGVIGVYEQEYGEEDAMEWLILDLDRSFPTNENNYSWGVFRKWRSLTPTQRRFFYEQAEAGNYF